MTDADKRFILKQYPDHVFHIYDEPPEPYFWLLRFVAKGDIVTHQALYDVPLAHIYAYADKMIAEDKEMRQWYKDKGIDIGD